MAADDIGNLYLVGRSSGAGASGLAFKLGIDGRSLGSDRYGSGLGMSFQDVAVMAPGFGVIAALQELSPDDFGWLQVDFGCTEDCE